MFIWKKYEMLHRKINRETERYRERAIALVNPESQQ